MDRAQRTESALEFLLDALDHQHLPPGASLSLRVYEGIAYGHAALNPDPTTEGEFL